MRAVIAAIAATAAATALTTESDVVKDAAGRITARPYPIARIPGEFSAARQAAAVLVLWLKA
jgi:hypothetical protein